MKSSEKPDRAKDNRQRDSSPRPQTQTKTKKKVHSKPTTLVFLENREIDKVKRYFIGKELQKVWKTVSYTGRQRIVKHYASVNVIICEDEVEEPHPDEDDSIPSQQMEPEELISPLELEFETLNHPDLEFDNLCHPSSSVDFTGLLRDPVMFFPPTACLEVELIFEKDRICLNKHIEPVFDFYEFICDDTWSKVRIPDPGCTHNSEILQGKLDQENDAQGYQDEYDAQAARSPGSQKENEKNGFEGTYCEQSC